MPGTQCLQMSIKSIIKEISGKYWTINTMTAVFFFILVVKTAPCYQKHLYWNLLIKVDSKHINITYNRTQSLSTQFSSRNKYILIELL